MFIDFYANQKPTQGHLQRLRSLLIIDSDAHYCQTLTAFLELYRAEDSYWFQTIHIAHEARDGLKIANEQRPDLILLDIEFPPDRQLGLEILYQLQCAKYTGKIGIISSHGDPPSIFQAMKLGASGYLLKQKLAAQLPDAIQAWAGDRVYLGPDVSTSFFQLFRGPNPADAQLETLTTREREVLQLLVEGASNQMIADHLYVTIGTVKAHLTSIFVKLKVTSRTQAIVQSVKLGLVAIAESESKSVIKVH